MTTEAVPQDTVAQSIKKYVPKPNDEEYHKTMNEINKVIEGLKAKMTAINEKLSTSDSVKAQFAPAKTELKNQMDQVNTLKNSINQERNLVWEKIKTVSASIKKVLDQVKSSKDKVGFKNANDVKSQISTLEKELSAGKLSLAEEKKIVNEISGLKKSLKSFESVSSQQSVVENDRKTLDELREQLKALDAKRDECKSSGDQIKAKMDSLAKEIASKAGKSSTLIDEKNVLRAKLDKAYDELKQVRSTHKKVRDEYYTWLKAESARKKEEYQKRAAEEKDEKLRIAAEKELERASIPAFTDELAACSSLAAYLTGFLPDSKEAEESKPKISSNSKAMDASIPEGATVMIKKSERDEDFFVGKKPKKSGKRNNTPAVKPFKLDLEMIDLFSRLKVEIPVSISEIPKSLDSIQEKKNWFLDNQASQTLAAQEAAKAKIEALKKNGLPDEPVEVDEEL